MVADLVGTPHFVVRGKGGEVFKRILRSPFGTLISETAEEFRVPIGFHGGVEDVSGSGAVLISGMPFESKFVSFFSLQGDPSGQLLYFIDFDLQVSSLT